MCLVGIEFFLGALYQLLTNSNTYKFFLLLYNDRHVLRGLQQEVQAHILQLLHHVADVKKEEGLHEVLHHGTELLILLFCMHQHLLYVLGGC